MDAKSFRQEILEEVRREAYRGMDKTITVHENPIRWFLLHYFIGLNVMVTIYFFLELLPKPPFPIWSKFWATFIIPATVSILHFRHARGKATDQPVSPISHALFPPREGEGDTRPWIKRFGTANRQELLTLLMFLLWAGGFFLIAYFIDPAEASHVGIPMDDRIPFFPPTVFIYLGLYTMYILPYMLVKDAETFKVIIGSYITILIIGYVVFLFFPTSIVRPEFEVTNFSTWVLGIVYAADKPVNCFPSMHVAMVSMSALMVWELNRVMGTVAIIYGLAIAVSTVFTKQHFILDVVAGLILTAVVYYAYFKQKIMRVVGRNMRHWEKDMQGFLGQWVEQRLWPILEKSLKERIDDSVKKALKERNNKEREKTDTENGD